MTGPVPYVGGKNRLAKKIISLLPGHRTYVEPFAGGAQVLFHKPPSKVEVLNDLSFDVANFFRVCQWHHEELIRHMRYLHASRKLYQLFSATDPDLLTDVQRAARFLFLQKMSFGGLVEKQAYHYGVAHPSNFNPHRIPYQIEQAHERLQAVQIECSPYEDILARYDRKETFFYFDTPYWGPKLYKYNFDETDFRLLAERLNRLKGRFILSLNDRPEVRDVFGHFDMQECDIVYTAKAKPGKRHRELLIANFPLTSPRDGPLAAPQ